LNKLATAAQGVLRNPRLQARRVPDVRDWLATNSASSWRLTGLQDSQSTLGSCVSWNENRP